MDAPKRASAVHCVGIFDGIFLGAAIAAALQIGKRPKTAGTAIPATVPSIFRAAAVDDAV